MCVLFPKTKAHMYENIMTGLLKAWLYSYGPFDVTILTILWHL